LIVTYLPQSGDLAPSIVIDLTKEDAKKLWKILEEWEEYASEYPVEDANLASELQERLRRILF